MKKRLLTAWIIACMFICLVGQTPITALADGDDTRVISVPEGLQDVLINETPETQTAETEIIKEESTDVQTQQNDENNDVQSEQGEATDESDSQNQTVGEDETSAAQNEVIDETSDANVEQTEKNVTADETPAAQNETATEIPAQNQPAQGENVIAETVECVEQSVEALLPEGTHNHGDIVRVSGLLPKDAIVEAIPVDVEIEGQIVLLAYDITIYENEEKKNAGICWQPEEGGLNVEFISSALEESEEEVNIWHMEDSEQDPEYVTAAPSSDDSVEFTAESFSVYVVTETKLTATIIASDGNTYEINVTYDNKSGIPMEGTALKVDELKPGDDGYDEYIEESASKVGAKAEDLEFSKVFDIKIVDENDENKVYEPTGNVDVSIRVIGVSLSEYPQVNVLHFVEQRNAESYLIYDVAPTVKEETVEFTTDSFSVYVVIGHEGGEVKTPRVEFHFINYENITEYTDGSTYYYAADKYPFKNKGNDPDANPAANYTQYTQILKNGESLELIADPPNSGYNYFYGWYVVDPKVISGTTDDYGVGTSDGKLYYTWPENPNRITFESPISITGSNVNIGDIVDWSLNGVSGSGAVDEDGNIHVLLAPIYDNYHFVNFMLRPYGTPLNNLMTRKMIALGSSTDTEVRIDDVNSNSTDPVHLVFTGWGYYDNTLQDLVTKQTLDYSGAHLTDPGRDGVYMLVDLGSTISIDLYPVFIEARWVDFFVGVSGSGATYVPSRFLESWGRATESNPPTDTPERNVFDILSTSTRAGYSFDGWYAFANTDKNGDITNLDTPQDVSVSYLMLNGDTYETHTVTVNTTAVKVANGDGSIVNSGTWSVTDNGDGTGSVINSTGTHKLFETSDGKLRLFDPLDRLKLSAKWESNDSQITVVYWTENIQDKNYVAPSNPKDDYTASAVKVINTADINTQLGTSFSSGSVINYLDLLNYQDNGVKVLDRTYLDDVGAVPAGEEIFYDLNDALSDTSSNPEPTRINGDGSTTLNVYFERKTFKLVFHIGRDGYVKNSGQMKNDSYPNWDGNWIEYMYNDSKVTGLGYTGKGNTSYSGVYSMSYGGKTYDSTYETWVSNPNTDHAQGNVMGDYVPGSDLSRIDNDANLYVIEAKYGAYIGDRWPSPTNPNFEFSNAAGSGKTLYIWTAYWDSRYAYIANNRPTSNNQGNNSDINGVHEYMSAELCTNRRGTGLINENQVHHLVAYFGEANNNKRFKRYHYLIEAIDGTYDSTVYQTVQGSGYTGYPRTTWSEQTPALSSAIADKEYYKLSDSLVISNLEPEYQLGWELDGYELVYSCYDSAQHPNTTKPSQKEYDIYFFYRPKQYTLTFNLGNTTKVDNYYYNETLAGANKYTNDVTIPEGYYFKGWYINSGGLGEAFDFANEKMPSQNVVLYPVIKPINYTVKIDPNGGTLDHRYNTSVSTYFNSNYGTQVGEYSVDREYIKLSDKELTVGNPQYYTGTKYYYINTQRLGIQSEGDWGLPIELRNACYVEESDLDNYYNWYANIIDTEQNKDPVYWTGIEKLSKQEFIDNYTDYPYRPLSGEHYTFMGWYQVLANGSVAEMPYNFNDPVKDDLELRAMWRLDGGYYIQYNPYFFVEENGLVTAVIGEMQENTWTDPVDPSKDLYADQSSTLVLQAPTNITPGWVFRGWRVVRQNGEKTFTDSNGTHTYPNWESYKDTNYYQPGDPFMIDEELVSEVSAVGKVINMQAWYEHEDNSYRRPEITNIVLDSNDDYLGYVTNINQQLPQLSGPGHEAINTSNNLYNGNPTQIEIGDIQSNIALHLDDYRTFFAHTNGYFLLGFDENSNPDSPTTGNAFIPAYATDSVLAVTRDSDETIYALWEPMVYATFVNNTAVDLTVDLSGTSSTISVVNEVTGIFDREASTTNITVPANGRVKVVLPKAIPGTDTITATAANNHLNYKLSVNGVFADQDPYGTGSENVKYTQNSTYTGTLQTDATGIVITYTEEEDPTIVYDVNSGVWQESSACFEQSLTDPDLYTIKKNNVEILNRYKPADPIRTGKLFIGWTTNKDIASKTDFSSETAVTWGNTTITPDAGGIVLDKIKSDYLWDFTKEPPYASMFYAVWSDTVTVTFNVAYSKNTTDNPQDLHTWTDSEQSVNEPYKFYRSDSGQRLITYTMAKGEKVPLPSDPIVSNTKPTWKFVNWLTHNVTTDSYRYSAKVPSDGNLTTYKFDFSQRVVSDVTIVTSWTEIEPQIFTFNVYNRVEGVNTNTDYDYTIAVTNELVRGKFHSGDKDNQNGISEPRWGSVTTKLKNNQHYKVVVTVQHITNWGGAESVGIKVIDSEGNVIKDGQLFYCEGNTYKNFNADYKYTLTITQNTSAKETTVTTENLSGSVTASADNDSRTFTFYSCERRTNGQEQAFPNEVNNYENGSMDNSLDIIFTNTNNFIPAPTNYVTNYNPFFMMFGFGAILVGLIVPTVVMLKRRKEEEE